MRLWRMLMAVVVLITLIWMFGDSRKGWTEDVQLDDGSTVVVERKVRFTETNSLSGDAYNSVDSASSLRFTGSLSNLPAWSAPLLAHTLYKDAATQEWVLVAMSYSCDVWRERGKPNPPYWEYHLRNGQWVETPVSAVSIGRKSNLLRRYQQKLPSEHLSVTQKDELQHDVKKLEQMDYAERSYRIVVPAFTKPLDYCS